MLQALKEAAVGYRRSWRTTAAVLLLLGLGIGANTASVSVAVSALRNPIAVSQPDRLVVLDGAFLSTSGDIPPTSPLLDYGRYLRTFAALAAFSEHDGGVNLRADNMTVRAQGAEVSPRFFEAVGVRIALRRGFRDDEEASGRNRVLVISHELWQSTFRGTRDVIGRAVTLNAVPFTVIGVAAPYFRFPRNAQLWIPVCFGADRIFTGPAIFYTVLGRLKDDVSMAGAVADIDALREGIKRESPSSWLARKPVNLIPLTDRLVSRARMSIVILVIATALVWLVSAANAAYLLLSRTLGRAKELSIRMALGASPARLGMHFLAEALLLAGLGAVSGLASALVALRMIGSSLPADFLLVEPFSVMRLVLTVGLSLALLTGLVSILPGLIQVMERRTAWLRAVGVGTHVSGREASRLSGALVACQIALAFVLAVGALGLARTSVALQRVDVGFHSADLVALSVSLPPARYPSRTAPWPTASASGTPWASTWRSRRCPMRGGDGGSTSMS
jgi:putative ABC transport system permease protein